MASHDTHSERLDPPVGALTRTTVESGRGILERYRERAAARKRSRLLSDRNRRALAQGLRRTADPKQPPARFDCCPLLHDRVAAERSQLLAIATALEQGHDPDPACVALIHELLTNGCSPLYNENLPAADLHTTLTRVRAGLGANSHT